MNVCSNDSQSTTLSLLATSLPATTLVLDYGAVYPLLRRGRYVDWVDDVGYVPDVSRLLCYKFLTGNIKTVLSPTDEDPFAISPDPDSSILHKLQLPGASKSLYDELLSALQSSSATVCCELLSDILDAAYAGDIAAPIVMILDGIDSSSPHPEGYIEGLGSRRKKDIKWHSVYYFGDYEKAELSIPVDRLSWTKPLFDSNGDVRPLPKGSSVVMSSSKGDYPVPESARNDAHMRIRRKVLKEDGKIVKLTKYDEDEYMAVTQAYMSENIGTYAGWNLNNKDYESLFAAGKQLPPFTDLQYLQKWVDVGKARDMAVRSGCVPGEVLSTVMQL